MWQFIPSQCFINWLTHKCAPVKGLYYAATTSTSMKLGQIECLRVTPNVLQEGTSGDQNVCTLYFFGGANTVGSPRANEDDARRLAMSCAATVISVRYITAINEPYPAAMDDAEAA